MASALREATLGKALCLPPHPATPHQLPKPSWATVENIIGAHACLVRRHRKRDADLQPAGRQAGFVCSSLLRVNFTR